MPRGNGMGPYGGGPMTGRGAGFCAGCAGGAAVPAGGWPMVEKRVRGARDAFSAPDGQFVAVLTGTELNVYRLNGSRIGRLLFRTSAPAWPVVQVRWASGAEADRWNRELAAVAATTPAKEP